MKRILFTLLTLATLFSFVACSDPSGEDTDDTSVVELEILAGYENTQYNCLYFTPIAEGSGYTDFNIEYRYESETGNQCSAKLRGDAENDASGSIAGSKSFQLGKTKCLGGESYEDWSTGSAVRKDCTDSAYKIEFCIQDSNWQAVAGKVYVKKAWLSGKGKDNLVLDLKTGSADSSGNSDSIKVTIDENNLWGCCLYFTPIPEGSGYTSFHFEYKFESEKGKHGIIKLSDNGEEDASASFSTEEEGFQLGEVVCFSGAMYDKWDNDAKKSFPAPCRDKADRIAFLAQDENYAAVTGTFYVKRAWLTGDGKEDLVLDLKTEKVK